MALLLIKATNATHIDPTKDQRGCYKRGDVVSVYEDDAHNGDVVTNPIMPPMAMVRVRSGDIGSLGANVGANATTILLGAGQGAALTAAPPFFAVIGDQPFSGTGEVVRVNTINGDSLGVTRGIRGTTPQAWPTGMAIERLITKQMAEKYIAHHTVGEDIIRRRLWWVLVDSLPAGILSDLQADRWVTVTWPQVRNYFQNKETGETEAEP